jgi:hypothetical protein
MPPALTSVLHQSTNTSANENSWKSRDGTGYGWIPFGIARSNGAIIVEDSSVVTQISGGAFYACHWDGGNPNFENATNRNQMLITVDGGSQYQYPKGLGLQPSAAGAQTMASSLRYRFTSDSRATATDRKNAKRSSGTNTTFYNTPRQTARPWSAYLGNGPNTTQGGIIGLQTQYIVNAQNIPVYTFTENMAVPATGITFTAEYTRFGAIKGS